MKEEKIAVKVTPGFPESVGTAGAIVCVEKKILWSSKYSSHFHSTLTGRKPTLR